MLRRRRNVTAFLLYFEDCYLMWLLQSAWRWTAASLLKARGKKRKRGNEMKGKRGCKIR
jgi:hypothetical protein